ncbi:helix-turn-helix domain-containing protein [Halopseudomonas salina]|uniref:AraC family transcriptional regulator n=1 Tax=Halopseudomonas salina TaxID=1323744 RepID=A0ABQ1PHN2_9GAMM|nr:AraC family transcriptional regulator [Halopseudomonas salina]GGC97476.1 AraC family transcriptional regulator [Halopseudomonas salina]
MNQILHPLPCERLQERAFWAQGIGQTLAKEYGKSTDDLPDDLQQYFEPTDLSSVQISQTDMNRLWHAAGNLAQDDCFGLKMGQNYRSNTLKVLGLAAVSSATVGDALQRVIRFFSVFSTQVQLYSVEDDQHITVYFQPRGTPHPMHMEALLSHCKHIWDALGPATSSMVLETRLIGDHERTRTTCENIFGKRIRPGSKRVAVKFNRHMMNTPLPAADAFLVKRLDATLEDMLGAVPNIDFAEQVKQRIRVLVSEREVSEDLVATPFNMSPRHLRRKLSETQTTYEKLLDEVRMELAIRLIQDGKLNLGRIAFELGFLDPSSFTRAFRRWTGMSPTAFRSQSRQGGSVTA